MFNANRDIMYVHKQLAVRHDVMHWVCTNGLLLIKHAVLSVLCDASVHLVSTASSDTLAPSYFLRREKTEV
jgi:hypothetical protein